MINFAEAQELMNTFINLKQKASESGSKSDIKRLEKHKTVLIEKLRYLVDMRVARYRQFPNYEDLVQEGMLGLVKSIETFKNGKGNIFSWAHTHIKTRISRSANAHSTIRFPMKAANAFPPHKETQLPLQIDNVHRPDVELEMAQIKESLRAQMDELLTQEEKQLVEMAFGFDGDKGWSIAKIVRETGIKREVVIAKLKHSLELMGWELDF